MAEDDDSFQIVKKKYKLWNENQSVPVPLRTIQRWETKTLNDSFLNNGDVNEVITNASSSSSYPNDTQYDEVAHLSDSSNLEDLDSDRSGVHSNSSTENESVFSDIARNSNDHGSDHNDSDFLEEDSDDNEYNPFDGQDHVINRLLYENSSMTLDESVVTLLDLYVQHKWTKASLRGALAMLQKMLPEDNNLPKTVFKLFQYVQNLVPSFNVIKHFYCKKCSEYNGINSTINKCASCNANKTQISFFFEVDIREQIKYMFENRNLAEKLKSRPLSHDKDVISDVTDGSEYLRVNSHDSRQRYDLTLMLNTDGLSLVKSSKSHCWPLMFMIAELPEHLRESFLIIIGLWYDTECKPEMNTFLKPFCSKLRECFHEGVSWVNPKKAGETIVSKIIAPLIVADAPARAQIQNIQNFNGRYGCNICEIKMKQSKRVEGKRTTRIYPFNETNSKLRTGERMQKQAQKLLQRVNKTHVKGVKGKSIISKLPLVDLGTCVLPEYLHCALLGIGRQFINLWVNKRGPWSLKRFLEQINTFLLGIRPPHFFSRLPRPITLVKFYKASEFYNWILFYSLPALVNHLPAKYLQHWILFVKALFILLQNDINKSALEEAEGSLKLFVKQIETLYSDRELTYNVHQLLHLVLVVKRWGPLWATSAFPFESFNGFLGNCVHGTKHLGQEMMNNLHIAQGLQILKSRVTESNAVELSTKIKTQLIGKTVENIAVDDCRESEVLTSHNLNQSHLDIHARAKIDNEIYTSQMYKTTKTNSHTVRINLVDNSVLYGSIRYFFEIENHLICLMIDCFTVKHDRIFCHARTRVKVDHILPIEETNTLVLIKANQIRSMYHVIRVGEYICKRPNLFKKVL